MYKKILIPLDGSKLGEAAIPFVEELVSGAKESQTLEINLLQVLVNGVAVGAGGEYHSVPYTKEELEQTEKWVIEYLEKVGANLKKSPNVAIKAFVRVGDDPAVEILKVSDELKVDLIAISTHGRSGVARWAIGSVADKILRNGNAPVLMVRALKQPG